VSLWKDLDPTTKQTGRCGPWQMEELIKDTEQDCSSNMTGCCHTV